MTDADRVNLLFGPYRTPRVAIGRTLTCEARDADVIVVGYSDAPIPWPVGQRRGRGASALVVYGALADAVRRESNQAVAYWFGVTPQTVTKWRKALDVLRANEGTHRLHHDNSRSSGRGKPSQGENSCTHFFKRSLGHSFGEDGHAGTALPVAFGEPIDSCRDC